MKGLAIRGIGVVSVIGVGFEDFAKTLRGDTAPPPLPPSPAITGSTRWPVTPAHWLAEFDAKAWLGEKGLGSLDRATLLALVACKQALQGVAVEADSVARSRIGVVLGSMCGNMGSIADFVRSTYTPTPHMVSPMQFPNTVMNCAASQCAIWHGLKGINSTVCAGDLSGLAALRYASRMLRLGYAQCLLAGSVEEYCDFTAWAHAASNGFQRVPLGEGAAVFALSGPDDTAATSLLATCLRTVPVPTADNLRDALAREVSRALAYAGFPARALTWWSGRGTTQSRESEIEAAALCALEMDTGMQTLPQLTLSRCGETYAASFSLQLAGALATAPAGLGLLTAVNLQGQVGCAVVRTTSPGSPLSF